MLIDKSLESVYAVYKEGSFSKAAQKLYVSQPALSAMVKKVETELHGIPLFDRSTSPVRPTEAGLYFIQAAEKAMQLQADVSAYFDRLAKVRYGEVRVGGAAFFITYVLPPLAAAFRDAYPGYEVTLFEMNVMDGRDNLRAEELDILFGTEALDPRLFEAEPLGQETILLAVPASFPENGSLEASRLTVDDIRAGRHRDPAFPGVALQAFAEEPFLMLKKGNDLYARSMEICGNAGFEPHAVLYLDQMNTMFNLVCSGQGAAFIRDLLIVSAGEMEKACYYKLADPHATREIRMTFHKGRALNEAGQAFARFMKENAHSLGQGREEASSRQERSRL